MCEGITAVSSPILRLNFLIVRGPPLRVGGERNPGGGRTARREARRRNACGIGRRCRAALRSLPRRARRRHGGGACSTYRRTVSRLSEETVGRLCGRDARQSDHGKLCQSIEPATTRQVARALRGDVGALYPAG